MFRDVSKRQKRITLARSRERAGVRVPVVNHASSRVATSP